MIKFGRLIAVGDIHGEIEKLNNLLGKINPQKSDKLVFLGDYIDRGKNSKEVIERLLKLSKTTNCIFLKGNHEDMLLKARTEEDVENWLLSGGNETLASYDNFKNIFKLHNKFFNNLKRYHIENGYLFSHAGINPNKTIENQTDDDLFWIRDKFYSNPNKLPYKVVFGHTAFKIPFIQKDKIGIDTGCGKIKEGKLTALICGKDEIITSD